MYKGDFKNENRASAVQKCVKIEDACRRYSLGKNSMRAAAAEAGAVIHIGRCVQFNVDILDAYFDSLAGCD